MRLIKLFILAAIASMSALAFIGAGSASAETLCASDNGINGICPLSDRRAIGVTIQALTTEPALFLIDNTIEMECHSFLKAKTTKNEGAHVGLSGTLEELTFKNCKGNVCKGLKEKAENLPFNMLWVGLNQHTLISKGGSGLTPGVLFEKCVPTFEFDCLYELASEPALLDLTLAVLKDPPKPAHLTALKIPLKSPMPFCAAEMKFDALYVITEPLPFFLASLP